MFRPILFAALAWLGSGFAEGEPPATPAIKKIGEHLYSLGEIKFDAQSREIRFPVVVNMREGGPIEYVLVRETGKVHESIFVTAISPMELQIVLKLLKYQGGFGDIFNKLLAPEALAAEGGSAADRGEGVDASFLVDGAANGSEVAISEFVVDGGSAEAMPPGPWIYTGSVVEGGTFMAEAEGSMFAVYLDHLALFNCNREGADDDDRWGARTSAIPEIGTKGVFLIRRAKKDVTK
jgi:hypothetical protein